MQGTLRTLGELSQLVEESWNYGSSNGQEDLSWGLGLGTGIQSLLSPVAAGEPPIPTEVPLPVTMVSKFVFDYGEFRKDALGRIPQSCPSPQAFSPGCTPYFFWALSFGFLLYPGGSVGILNFHL